MGSGALQAVATCIGCGCTDLDACLDPDTGVTCSWLRVDRAAGVGVCSVCDEELERWHAGDRTVAVFEE